MADDTTLVDALLSDILKIKSFSLLVLQLIEACQLCIVDDGRVVFRFLWFNSFFISMGFCTNEPLHHLSGYFGLRM